MAANDLVDVSLFQSPPTDDSRFALPTMQMNLADSIVVSSWDEIPAEFRPIPLAARSKPLPPLPQQQQQQQQQQHSYHLIRNVKTDSRPRCILTKLKCCRDYDSGSASASASTRSSPTRKTQQRRSVTYDSYQQHNRQSWVRRPGNADDGACSFNHARTVGAPNGFTVTWEPSGKASKLVWLPEQQVWLRSIEMIAVKRPLPSAHLSATRPRYVRPYQFPPRPMADRNLLLFQQATQTVSLDDCSVQLPSSHFGASGRSLHDPSQQYFVDNPPQSLDDDDDNSIDWSTVDAPFSRPSSTPPYIEPATPL